MWSRISVGSFRSEIGISSRAAAVGDRFRRLDFRLGKDDLRLFGMPCNSPIRIGREEAGSINVQWGLSKHVIIIRDVVDRTVGSRRVDHK